MADVYAALTFSHDSTMKPHTDSPSSISDESSHGFDDVNQGFPSFDDFLPNSATTFADSFNSADTEADLPAASEESSSGPKRRSRRPPNTAERRATHNAVERARRETLNGRFMDLAAALPSMAHVKRPSKSMIVNKSLDFIETALAREKALLEQNDSLRSQLNELRAQRGLAPLDETPLPSWPQKKAKSAANTNQKPVERRDSMMSLHSEQSQSDTSPRTISSVETPNTDSSNTSPMTTSVPLSTSQNAKPPVAVTQDHAHKFGSGFDSGELWGMRAQLQAAAQAAVANASGFNPQSGTPSFSFDPFVQQQSSPSTPQAGGMDLGAYLMALQRQQQHQQTPYLQGIGAYSQSLNLQPHNMPALSGSQAQNLTALSSFGSTNSSDRASSWF